MSERFGIPDHAPQHAPDHAPQNPTAQGSWGQPSGGSDWASPTPPTYSGGYGGGYGGTVWVDPHKSVKTAVVLAMLFGPLGLFYVGVLNGVVALFVAVPLARELTFALVFALGGRIEPFPAIIPILWSITVPWAILGARWRNRKIDRAATR
jgi:hypothetical protein